VIKAVFKNLGKTLYERISEWSEESARAVATIIVYEAGKSNISMFCFFQPCYCSSPTRAMKAFAY